nr:asparagine synthase (glutamine-hydrolyzing) [Ensifer aridi]
MCGLNIIFSSKGRINDVHNGMADAIRHRGPDAVGTWSDGHCALSHTKLSIQDFSSRSNQPLEYRNLVIVFNGEIYNAHAIARELGVCGERLLFDGEVIGPAYSKLGDALWGRLDGEFAIAIYDKAERRLTVARDRIGAKPLYYQVYDGDLYLSSEIKGLRRALPQGRSLDFDRVCFDLVFGPWGPKDATFFKEVKKVPPAHYLTAITETFAATSYWSADHRICESSGDNLAAALETSICERVAGNLPIAVFLSGGIDSSTVAALAKAKSSNEVVAYSARYPGAASADENHEARSVCDRLGIDLRFAEVTAADATLKTWDEIIGALEEPPWDIVYLPVWNLYRAASSDGFRVVLTGQGNDELWCGYRNEESLSLAIWRDRSVERVARAFRDRLLKVGVGRVGKSGHSFAPLWTGHGTSEFLKLGRDIAYIASHISSSVLACHSLAATRLAMNSALSRHLDQEDRLGMAHGIESRLPLLSNRLIDLALTHHAGGKDDKGLEKAAFRAAAARFVGTRVANRPKRSFPAPPADVGCELCEYVLDNWPAIRASEIGAGLINPSISVDDAVAIIKTSPQIGITLASLHRFAQLWLSEAALNRLQGEFND